MFSKEEAKSLYEEFKGKEVGDTAVVNILLHIQAKIMQQIYTTDSGSIIISYNANRNDAKIFNGEDPNQWLGLKEMRNKIDEKLNEHHFIHRFNESKEGEYDLIIYFDR